MNNNRKEEARKRIRQTKDAAHERVVKDGTIQFRLDAANMERLLKVADECQTGAGVLARMWVLDRLNNEIGGTKASTPRAYFVESQSSPPGVREEVSAVVAPEPPSSRYVPGVPQSGFANGAEYVLLTHSLGEALAILKDQTSCCNQLIAVAETQNNDLSELRATVREQGERLAKLQLSMKNKSGKAK
jgi:hypothetical protein